MNAEQRLARRDKKAFLGDQCKEIEENNIMGKTRDIFKGLALVDRAPEELWMEVCDIVQEAGVKTIPKKRNVEKQNGCLRRPYK